MKRIIIKGKQGCGKTSLIMSMIKAHYMSLDGIRDYHIFPYRDGEWVHTTLNSTREVRDLIYLHKISDANIVVETQLKEIPKELMDIFQTYKIKRA